MKVSDPPRLGVWLLEHFGPEINQEALAGDLQEGFSQRQSNAWYWRQVLAAIPWRKHLRYLLIAVGCSWFMTWPDLWGALPSPSRPLNMAIFMIGILVIDYLPGMLRRRVRFILAVLIVVFFCWLYQYHHMLYDHYSILGFIAVSSLLFHRKRTAPSPHPLTWRELIKGDPDAERERLIKTLHLDMLREQDPELRQAYAQAITTLQNNKASGSQPRDPSLA